jgi:hypothetical protein
VVAVHDDDEDDSDPWLLLLLAELDVVPESLLVPAATVWAYSETAYRYMG